MHASISTTPTQIFLQNENRESVNKCTAMLQAYAHSQSGIKCKFEAKITKFFLIVCNKIGPQYSRIQNTSFRRVTIIIVTNDTVCPHSLSEIKGIDKNC